VWVLPAAALLARCAQPVMGRLVYGALPWLLGGLAAAAPRRVARWMPLATAPLALAAALSMHQWMEPSRAAGRTLAALVAAAREAQRDAGPAARVTLEKTPVMRDGAFLCPGGLAPVCASADMAQGREPVPIHERGSPQDSDSLASCDRLVFAGLPHASGMPCRPVEDPAAKPAHLVARTLAARGDWRADGPGVFESPPLDLPLDVPYRLRFRARALLAPRPGQVGRPGRPGPISWGRVLLARAHRPEWSERESTSLLLVADGRWRDYEVLLRPWLRATAPELDLLLSPGTTREELSRLRRIRLQPLEEPGRVWIERLALDGDRPFERAARTCRPRTM
jgi:hypothetical protein